MSADPSIWVMAQQSSNVTLSSQQARVCVETACSVAGVNGVVGDVAAAASEDSVRTAAIAVTSDIFVALTTAATTGGASFIGATQPVTT